MARTETAPIFTPWRHPIFHHKEAEQAQQKLNRATSPNHRALLPLGHRTRYQDCILGHLPGGVSLLTPISTEAAEKETNHYMAH